MKKTLDILKDITGIFCLLLFTAEIFYFGSNDYFLVLGKFRDFSIYVWLLMFVIWGIGFWQWLKRKKSFVLMFACWLSIVSFAFDCHRFVIFAGDDVCRMYLKVILVAELLLIVSAFNFKLIDFFKIATAAFLCTFFGYFFLYPAIFPVKSILLFSSAVALLWIFSKQNVFKGIVAYIVKIILYLYLLYAIVGSWWCIYDRTHGIRFYEKPVTEVSDNIKVSVVVPVYNAEDVIKRALDSLRHQTLKDIEIICVDDGSTDKTPEILAEYAAHDKRIKVIRQENAFVGMARNRGMAEAKGEFIGFMDNDDWVSKDYYEELYKIAKEKQANIAETKMVWDVMSEYYPHAKRKGMRGYKDKQIMDTSSFDGFSEEMLGHVWDKIYKRSFLEENHINFTPYRTIYEDSYFAFQIYMNGEPIAVSEKGAYYYWEGPSYSRKVIEKPTDEAVPFFKAFEKMIKDHGFDKEKEETLLAIHKNHRNRSIQNYYEGIINEKGRQIWRERVLEAFPDDGIDFDKMDQEIAEKKQKAEEEKK